MIPTSRRTALLAGTLTTLLVLAGCGGSTGSKAPEPEARPAVGGYRLSTVITKSTIASNTAGATSRIATTMYLGCADTACSALLQRTASTGLPQGTTVRLTARPGSFTGQHIRTGECGGAVDGDFGESFTWTWHTSAEETLKGTLVQVFKGCGLDGTTTYDATATRTTGALPYLPPTQARAWIKDVDAYDVELGKVYVSGTECNTVASTTTVAEARCFARTYAAWRPDIDRLARRTSAVAARSTGVCRTALRQIRFGTWSTLVNDAATAYDAAHDRTSVRAGVKAETTATSFATTQHELLVAALAVCTDPSLAGTLGKDGTLQLDPDSVLQPLAG